MSTFYDITVFTQLMYVKCLLASTKSAKSNIVDDPIKPFVLYIRVLGKYIPVLGKYIPVLGKYPGKKRYVLVTSISSFTHDVFKSRLRCCPTASTKSVRSQIVCQSYLCGICRRQCHDEFNVVF